MRASMEFAAQAKERERKRERGAARRESEANTNAALQVQLSLSHLQYIKRHIYYIMEKQQSRGQTYTYTHAYICIRIREIQNQPSQACVRPTVWPKAEQTNQNRSEANRTTPNSDAGADDDADVAVTVAVASRRLYSSSKRALSLSLPGQNCTWERQSCMNERLTHTHTDDSCRRLQKKGANGDVGVSVAALCYCVGSKLS